MDPRAFNRGLNVQEKKRVVFELRQSSTTGFSWVSIRAHLTDINGGTAMVQVYDRIPNPDVSAAQEAKAKSDAEAK